MGIHNLNSYIYKNYSECFIKKYIFDYIYLDLNHILHNCISYSYSKNQFLFLISKSLDTIFNNYIARRKIFIAVDGTSPYSKILLQRKRRFNFSEKTKSGYLNPLFLTPGTYLMQDIHKFINDYIPILKNKYKYINIDIEFSDSNSFGEGEIKIMNNIVKNNSSYYSHMIIGNDADLIVSSLSSNIDNIYILMKQKKSYSLLSIDYLITLIFLKSPFINNNLHICNQDKTFNFFDKLFNDFKLDISFLFLIFGNDYLPKIYYINFDSILKSYFTYLNYQFIPIFYFDNNNICFKKDRLYLFFKIVNNNINNNFKKVKFSNFIDTKNYLEGLLWNLYLYSFGICSSYDFICNVSKITPFDICNFIINSNYDIILPISNRNPLTVYQSLTLLTPKKFNYILPKHIKNIINSDNFDACHLYNKFSKNEFSSDFINNITKLI